MVLLNVAVVCAVMLSPVVLLLLVASHVNVEGILVVKGILTNFPLQIVRVFTLVKEGNGFTVTVTVIVLLKQLVLLVPTIVKVVEAVKL